MGLIIIVLLVGFAAYKLIQFNTRSGAETVRAYVFLRTLHGSDDRATAEASVAGDPSDFDPEVVRQAINYVKLSLGGRQLPLIRMAYTMGMSSRVSMWQRYLIARS